MTLRVSAIVPTYNRAHLISRAIDSVLAQTYPEIELVIVDDGSTDATESVVKRYQDRVSSIRYVKKPNGGCASARNRGVEVASGELIAFLDSDDEWLPRAIESLVSALVEAGPEADFVYSPNIERIHEGIQFTHYPAAVDRPDAFAVEHFLTARARACAILYRRHVFDRVRMDEALRYNEDSDFLQRVALQFKAAYCPEITAIVHHHGANKSKDRVEILRSLLRSTERILLEYPEFHRALGPRADERRREIRKDLVYALLLRGDVTEARTVAAGDRFGGELDLLLRLGLAAPLRWKERIAQLPGHVQRLLIKLGSLKRRAGW